MSAKYKDLTGMRFGKLQVLKYSHTNKYRQAMFECVCDCGYHRLVNGSSLSSGHVMSCGCYQKLVAKRTMEKVNSEGKAGINPGLTHGESKTRLHSTWERINDRCRNKNRSNYKYYGGKGIKVCDEWKKYENFRDWALLNGYDEHLEIDRIDNSKDYEPSNCKWSTRNEQVRNRSNSIRLENGGTEKSMIEWCKEFGVGYKLAYARFRRGLDFDSIFKSSFVAAVTFKDMERK